MNGQELRAAIETLWPGHGAQARAARHFNIADRRIRDYISGARGVPGWMETEIRDLLEMFPGGVRDVDPRKIIGILQQQMVATGWTAGQSAASILAVAVSNAQDILGDDMVQQLLESR